MYWPGTLSVEFTHHPAGAPKHKNTKHSPQASKAKTQKHKTHALRARLKHKNTKRQNTAGGQPFCVRPGRRALSAFPFWCGRL